MLRSRAGEQNPDHTVMPDRKGKNGCCINCFNIFLCVNQNILIADINIFLTVLKI